MLKPIVAWSSRVLWRAGLGTAKWTARSALDRESFPRQVLRLVGLVCAVPLVLAWRHPALAFAAVLAVAVEPAVGGQGLLALALIPAVAAAVLAVVSPGWRAWLRAWLVGAARHMAVYRPKWRRVTGQCGLHREDRDGELVPPRLVRVRSTPTHDVLRVRLRPGQTPDDVAAQLPALAHAYRVGNRVFRAPRPDFIDRAMLRCDKPGTATILFPRADPLERPLSPFQPAPADTVDLEGLPVALGDDGRAYRLPLLYGHVLTAGAAGSGKGSVLWSTVNALVPAIQAGTVRAWGIDPKGGMELGLGHAVFARFGSDDGGPAVTAGLVEVVEDAALLVRERAARLAGKVRKHTPSVAEPHVVLVIDEIAFLTAYQPDRALRDRFNRALSVVLSQGRAVAVSVMGFVQDPRKETLPARSLFRTKIGLRLDSAAETTMVLGPDARERGAKCEAIPAKLPGVAYVLDDGDPTPRRVRFTHVADDDIRDLARVCAPPPPPNLTAVERADAAATGAAA